MTGMDITHAARVVGGRVEGDGGDKPLRGVRIDSREIEFGDLFVALPGTRTDGHRFVIDAFTRGAAAAIVGPEAEPLPEEFADRMQIRVKYPRKALADLARAHRARLKCPVIAITGSNGKSSTREMIAKVLEPLGPVVQAKKSFNNAIGLPLTILEADDSTAALVLEMGTNSRGDIAQLCGIARPDIGVITNVAPAHLDGLRDEDGVAWEKGHLAAAIGPTGALILNADDERVAAMADRAKTDTITTYGMEHTEAMVWGSQPTRTPRGVEVWLYGKMRLTLPVPGLHNAHNALAAAAVGLLFDIAPEQIRLGLRSVHLPSLRMQQLTFGGVTLFLDCYNANPASLQAAADELACRGGDHRRVLILGDMLELGARSREYHEQAGRDVVHQTDVLWCIGDQARAAYDGALAVGMHPDQVFWSPTAEDAIRDPAVELVRGDVVLLKASRGLKLERLADVLRRQISARMTAAAETADLSTSTGIAQPGIANESRARRVG